MSKNNSTRWTASEKIAFDQLRYADPVTFAAVADNKEWLINTSVEEAIRQGKVDKENKSQVFGYIHLRRMALVFDAFMALAED